ncbi:hypothetical protein Lgra_1437 [Legionella gratiana]|uniref:Uncharacterized protein n=1 Tax=Legionella gratiana TaxID=45066 RepID=A0A378JHS4_9GAMM|nr:hypothetical protein [Legionella gratiana]KTD11979.1 hypothetical protein Lgra_1437 [Legionella gratiana]STX46417.1 Uncharacterised protein [Legionella gratiana]
MTYDEFNLWLEKVRSENKNIEIIDGFAIKSLNQEDALDKVYNFLTRLINSTPNSIKYPGKTAGLIFEDIQRNTQIFTSGFPSKSYYAIEEIINNIPLPNSDEKSLLSFLEMINSWGKNGMDSKLTTEEKTLLKDSFNNVSDEKKAALATIQDIFDRISKSSAFGSSHAIISSKFKMITQQFYNSFLSENERIDGRRSDEKDVTARFYNVCFEYLINEIKEKNDATLLLEKKNYISKYQGVFSNRRELSRFIDVVLIAPAEERYRLDALRELQIRIYQLSNLEEKTNAQREYDKLLGAVINRFTQKTEQDNYDSDIADTLSLLLQQYEELNRSTGNGEMDLNSIAGKTKKSSPISADFFLAIFTSKEAKIAAGILLVAGLAALTVGTLGIGGVITAMTGAVAIAVAATGSAAVISGISLGAVGFFKSRLNAVKNELNLDELSNENGQATPSK